jgi:hypothetical protein
MDGISEDGSKAFFVTNTAITADDTDSCTNGVGCSDIYERDLDTGTTTLVSTGPQGGQSGYNAEFGGTTPDASRVWFHTAEPLVASDTDQDCSTPIPTVPTDPLNTCVDVYERSGGETTLLSTSPTKNPTDNASATFSGASADGAHVYFLTKEGLVAADTDNGGPDVYAREGGQTVLISDTQGPDAAVRGPYLLGGISGTIGPIDPSRIFLLTTEQWLPPDTDTTWDVYMKSGGALELATVGSNGQNGSGEIQNTWISTTGRLFFQSYERLTPDDPDSSGPDIYQRYNGETSLISKGPTGQSAGTFVTSPLGIADGGRRFFFNAGAQLVPEDTNDDPDVYVSIASESPQCDGVRPDRALLWPPNRTFRTVTLSSASDPDGASVTVSITGVTQDEPVGGSPDARHADGDDQVRLRAEGDRRGDGRVYRIAFEATDGQGGSCTGQATVSVPRRRGQAAVDSAPPSYDSFGR